MRVVGLAALAATCVGVAWTSTYWLPSQAEAPFAHIERPKTEASATTVASDAKPDVKTQPSQQIAQVEPQLSPASVVLPLTASTKTTTTTTTATTSVVAQTMNVVAQMPTEQSKPLAPSPSTSTQTQSQPVEAAEAKPVEPPKPALPTLIAKVNLSNQTMTVAANGKTIHSWKISSGAVGYPTPVGTFKPGWMAKMWHSKQYDDAPMPHAVFFKDGAAIHATESVHRLGSAASHGCVRLSPANAEIFYKLVQKHTLALTRVAVTGHAPVPQDMIARRAPQTYAQAPIQPVRLNTRPVGYAAPQKYAFAFPGDRPAAYAPRPVANNRAPYWVR